MGVDGLDGEFKRVFREAKYNYVEVKKDPGILHFWHGGNLDYYDDVIAQRGGRYEYGPGLYLITDYDSAKKYAKGSRKLYIVSVERGHDLRDAKLPWEDVQAFVESYAMASKKKEILEWLSGRVKDGFIDGTQFVNELVNQQAIRPSNTVAWRKFLIDQGVDYELVPNAFGTHSTMMVLYNMGKLRDYRQFLSGDRMSGSYDLENDYDPPKVRESAADRKDPGLMAWFGGSVVKDKKGSPLRVYHGTSRADRIGDKFSAKKATSGPMAYFTDDPEVASHYATGKRDTSLDYEEGAEDGYDNWFKVQIGRSWFSVFSHRYWYHLMYSDKPKYAIVVERAPHVTEVDDDIVYDPQEEGPAGNLGWEQALKYDAHGNYLLALRNLWLDSGYLFDEEERFLEVLRLIGLKDVKYENPTDTYPGIIPVYLKIEHPLYTDEVPDSVVDALKRASRLQKGTVQRRGYDVWDKRSRSPSEWLDKFLGDLDEGTSLCWTSIPDWVTRALTRLGYDGIVDQNGSHQGTQHTVYVPFSAKQVKSAIGNSGKYGPSAKLTESKEDSEYDHDDEFDDDELEAIMDLAEDMTDDSKKELIADLYQRVSDMGLLDPGKGEPFEGWLEKKSPGQLARLDAMDEDVVCERFQRETNDE